MKHGLTRKAIVLTNKSQQQFDELHQAYVHEFQPESALEMGLVDQIVAAQCRLLRIWRVQTAALDQTTPPPIPFTAVANDERALNSLLKLRKDKLRNDPEPPPSTSPIDPKPKIVPIDLTKTRALTEPRAPVGGQYQSITTIISNQDTRRVTLP